MAETTPTAGTAPDIGKDSDNVILEVQNISLSFGGVKIGRAHV